MRCFLSVGLLAFFIGLTGCPSSSPEETASGPDPSNGILVANMTTYDFGEVEPGQKIMGEVTLTNTGGKPVIMENELRRSCGCLAATKLEKLELAPGESGTLSFEYTVEPKPGEIIHKLYVDVTTGAPRLLEISLESNVRKVITSEPEQLTFQLTGTADLTTEVVLKSTDGEPFEITSIVGLGARGNITFEQKKVAASHQITITPDLMDLRDQPTDRQLAIRTTHPRSPEVVIEFEAILPFTVFPKQKRITELQAGKIFKNTIQVVSNFDKEFELGKITSEKNYITVTKTSKNEDGFGYTLEVEFLLPVNRGRPDPSKYVRDYLFIDIQDHPSDQQKMFFYGRTK